MRPLRALPRPIYLGSPHRDQPWQTHEAWARVLCPFCPVSPASPAPPCFSLNRMKGSQDAVDAVSGVRAAALREIGRELDSFRDWGRDAGCPRDPGLSRMAGKPDASGMFLQQPPLQGGTTGLPINFALASEQ